MIKINKKYPWAVNLQKLERAIAETHGGDEEQIKAKYISYAGLIRVFKEKVRDLTPKTKLHDPMKADEEMMTEDQINAMLTADEHAKEAQIDEKIEDELDTSKEDEDEE